MPISEETQISDTIVKARSLPSAPAGIVPVVLVPVAKRPSICCDSGLSTVGFGVGGEVEPTLRLGGGPVHLLREATANCG